MYVSGDFLPASRQAHVEFLDECGKWTISSGPGSEVKDSTVMILPKSSHVVQGNSLDEENRLNTPPQLGLGLHHDILPHEGQAYQSITSNDHFPIGRPCRPIMDFDDFSINPAFDSNDFLLSSLPSGSSDLNGPLSTSSISPRHITSETDRRQMVVAKASSVTNSHLEGARSLITSLVQSRKTVTCHKSNSSAETALPDVEDIMESLESLLPKTDAPFPEFPGLQLSVGNDFPSPSLFKTLLYSFTNNFAGLSDVPRTSIMQLIREHQQIRDQLFEVIKSGQPGVAKPLADSLFRAAVEGSDADAVATIILHTKRNKETVINPNDVVCSFKYNEYTPIELAAMFRNTELVRNLLKFGADPNKTCNPQQTPKGLQGALGRALGYRDKLLWDTHRDEHGPNNEPEPVNLGLLRLLLNYGAEVRVDLAENAIRPGPGHSAVAEELVSRLANRDHQGCFESQWLLICAIYHLENSVAYQIIRLVFDICSKSKVCGKCASEHPRLVEKMLCHAARRANLDLARFLAQHTAQLQSGLAAAIRASSDELVEFFLSKGARVDDPVEPWRQSNHSKECCPNLYDEAGYDRELWGDCCPQYVITPIRTPLAEAIRAQKDHLINNFERLGATIRLSEELHFHAAVLAAAEVGNTSYLKMVLGHASQTNDGSNLMLALAVAIRNEETDSALLLLDSGADLRIKTRDRVYGDPLTMALERRNKRVIDSMLECDIQVASWVDGQMNAKTPTEAAASWCDIELIDDLVRLGGDIDRGRQTTPLGAAVRSRNKILISQLLGRGVDHVATWDGPLGVTPLCIAMEIGDYDTARFLLSKGVSAADTCAFHYAMSHDPAAYEFLLSEFKSQFPHGLKGFGCRLLAQAIKLNSPLLMDSLLNAGVDVNSWSPFECTSTPGGNYTRRRYRALGLAIQRHKGHNYEIIRELLNRGAARDEIIYEYEWPSASTIIWIRQTPLLLAIQFKNLEVIDLLLEHGADLNRPARRGIKRTPLQAACETGSYSIVEFLLRKGARVNDAAAERRGGTALQLAAKSGSLKIVRLLLDNQADPYMPKSKAEGRTAFEAAAENGRIDILTQLWNAVLPLGFSDKERQSAKELARQRGHRGCVDFIDFLSSESSQSFLDMQV
jgi:ankyrin repeat protein